MKRLVAVVAAIILGTATATPVAPGFAVATASAADSDYQRCGRVFPDPHAYWPSPAQAPTRSPFAKGNAACAAVDFVSYQGMVDGLTYLESLYPDFVEFYELEEDFGDGSDCATSTDPEDLCSAGLPRQGVPNQRIRSDLYMVRLTDERVPDADKKFFTFPLSIHGIERAGAEAGVRAAEDLATWGYCEAVQDATLASNGRTNCALEGAIPHPLLETQPDASVSAGDALRRSAIYLVFANADGWRRGDADNLTRFFQRYNGNGVDLNRDWPTVGYTHRPYTPWSEPETRGFGKVMKEIRAKWDGGIDLHGQLIDRAFSFTLLGAGERDFGKNQRVLQTVTGAWQDAENRLSWSPLIKPNDAPDQCSATLDVPDCDERMWGVQWGTVWDTINYTVTGALGDWIDSPLGLDAEGIDNEMSMSHLINCGVGSCFIVDAEQLHVDGNKSLVYAMVNYSLLPEDTAFRVPGTVGYVLDPTVVSSPGSPPTEPPAGGLPPQASILDAELSPANGYRFAFDVLGEADGVSNGGIEARITTTNLGGIGAGSVASLVLERFEQGEPPLPQESACGSAGDGWVEVNRYYNQSSGYAQSGAAVHGNQPLPGRYRVCMLNFGAGAGVTDLDITFSREKAWEDPGQLPFEATNMRFFEDLAPYMADGQLIAVTAESILDGTAALDGLASLVIADDPLPIDGATAEQTAAWGAALRGFVEDGGNLVLTDGALRDLVHMGLVPAASVRTFNVYAGYIGFTRDGGATDTYDDPLAANVDQPGAAEGDGHRHQTYEPVPIGMDIGDRQSCSGAQCTAPVWTVDQTVWEAAGGRTAGTITANRTALGELPVGAGVVRIVGALLPMPTDRYYHPFGLANHAVTYSGYQVFQNALQWERPLPDLTVSNVEATSTKAAKTATVTALIENTGAAPAPGSVVRFLVDGTPIGQHVLGDLAAGGSATSSVAWSLKGVANGSHTITAIVDPANVIAETEEANNTGSRTVEVRGNKIQNGDFEASSNGTSPDAWTASGPTSYDGHSASAGRGGAWTSAPVPVTAGQTLGFSVVSSGAAGAVTLEQLGATGLVRSTLTLVAGDTLTVADGVTAVRVRLAGGLLGTTTFDDVRLWEE